MNIVQRIAVALGKYILTSISVLTIFGLTLAVAWSLPYANLIHYQLVATIFTASFTMMAGGYMMGKLMKSNHPSRHASEWGLLIGFLAFGYLFGIDWKWLAAVIISGILATTGGWFSEKQKSPTSG